MLAHGVHLVSKVCKLAELVEHVVQLVGCVHGRGGYLTGVDDHRLSSGDDREAKEAC
jgi:hypothetical protein